MRARTILGAISALSVTAGALIALAPFASAAPAAPYTAIIVENDPIYQIGTIAQNYFFDTTNATFQADAGPDHLTLTGAAGATKSTVSLTVPADTELVAGQSYPVRSDDTFGLGVLVGGDYCTRPNGYYQFGTMVVREATRDPQTRVLTSFAASYRLTCSYDNRVRMGEVAWKSTVGFAAAVGETRLPSPIFAGIDLPTAPTTVTYTARGPEPSVFGKASMAGDNPSVFVITEDTCSGATLAYGQSCRISVVPHVTVATVYQASLFVPDNSYAQTHEVYFYLSATWSRVGNYLEQTPPRRVLDTRTTKQPIGTQAVRNVAVATEGESTVVLNVTVTGSTKPSFLTVYRAGSARPTASSINFPAGWTGSNMVVVRTDYRGWVSIFNNSGSAHVIIDRVGMFPGTRGPGPNGSRFFPTVPERLYDSRTGFGKLPAGYSFQLPVDYGPESHLITSIAVNITAVGATRDGHLTVWNGTPPIPNVSTVNFRRGEAVPNMAIVPVNPCDACEGTWKGKPSIVIAASQDTYVIVDIVGFFAKSQYLEGGLAYTPMTTPTRIVDSRSNLGINGAVGPRGTKMGTAPASVLQPNTEALLFNVTGVQPTGTTFLTVWPNGYSDIPQPTVSNLNLIRNQIVSNATISLLGPTNAFNVYNNVGNTHVVMDVSGRFFRYVPPVPVGAAAAEAPKEFRLQSRPQATLLRTQQVSGE